MHLMSLKELFAISDGISHTKVAERLDFIGAEFYAVFPARPKVVWEDPLEGPRPGTFAPSELRDHPAAESLTCPVVVDSAVAQELAAYGRARVSTFRDTRARVRPTGLAGDPSRERLDQSTVDRVKQWVDLMNAVAAGKSNPEYPGGGGQESFSVWPEDVLVERGIALRAVKDLLGISAEQADERDALYVDGLKLRDILKKDGEHFAVELAVTVAMWLEVVRATTLDILSGMTEDEHVAYVGNKIKDLQWLGLSLLPAAINRIGVMSRPDGARRRGRKKSKDTSGST